MKSIFSTAVVLTLQGNKRATTYPMNVSSIELSNCVDKRIHRIVGSFKAFGHFEPRFLVLAEEGLYIYSPTKVKHHLLSLYLKQIIL